ncbi:MAG: hypothetical protein QW416_06640 [Candidatus Nitrosocaldaceae archaeon]
MIQIDNQHLVCEIFEYVAENGITTIDEISDRLSISKESALDIVELLIRFNILEYDDEYNICIKISKIAKIILS